MNLKSTLFLKLIGIIVIALIILSFLVYNTERISSGKHGFDRKILKDIQITYQSNENIAPIRICGITSDKIYFNDKDPRTVYVFDQPTKVWDTLKLLLPIDIRIINSWELMMDSIAGTFFVGNYGAAYYSPINAKDSAEVIPTRFEVPIFLRSTIISNQSVVLRAFDSTRKFLQFVKADRHTGKVKITKDIFEKLEDGGFSTDGMFSFDKDNKSIYYMQFYRNRFFKLDTNLTLLYEAKTIDTTNANPVFTRKKTKEGHGYIKPSVPLRQINEMLCVNNGLVYIISKLQADNETDKDFNENTVLDIYKGLNGEYIGSIYVPNIDKKKVLSFLVHGDKLIALYKNKIAIYHHILNG